MQPAAGRKQQAQLRRLGSPQRAKSIALSVRRKGQRAKRKQQAVGRKQLADKSMTVSRKQQADSRKHEAVEPIIEDRGSRIET